MGEADPPLIFYFSIFLTLFFIFFNQIYDTWQGCCRNISTKVVLLALFVSLKGQSASVGSSGSYFKYGY